MWIIRGFCVWCFVCVRYVYVCTVTINMYVLAANGQCDSHTQTIIYNMIICSNQVKCFPIIFFLRFRDYCHFQVIGSPFDALHQSKKKKQSTNVLILKVFESIFIIIFCRFLKHTKWYISLFVVLKDDRIALLFICGFGWLFVICNANGLNIEMMRCFIMLSINLFVFLEGILSILHVGIRCAV